MSRRATNGHEDPALLLRTYRRTHDPTTRERLVELHLPLVHALARRYANRGERFEDLVQVGSIGLIEAIDRFDPARGDDLTRFAVPTITGKIRHHLRDRSSGVRVPRRLAELPAKLRPSREALESRLCRSPTASELALEAGVPEEDIAEATRVERARDPAALRQHEDGDEPVGEIVVEADFDASDDRLLLAAAFRALSARERRILHLHFYAGLTQAEVGREVGLSQIQVSRLIRASLERLRAVLEDGWARSGEEQ